MSFQDKLAEAFLDNVLYGKALDPDGFVRSLTAEEKEELKNDVMAEMKRQLNESPASDGA